MPWRHADLRSWNDLSTLAPFAPFDVIMDKSTCDAIATSEHKTFTPPSSSYTENTKGICPTVLESIPNDEEATLSPVELLGLHLVPLTRKESTWIALSYSSFRFDLPILQGYWAVVEKTPIQAPSGLAESVAHAPRIYHWLYILRRK